MLVHFYFYFFAFLLGFQSVFWMMGRSKYRKVFTSDVAGEMLLLCKKFSNKNLQVKDGLLVESTGNQPLKWGEKNMTTTTNTESNPLRNLLKPPKKPSKL